MSHWLMKTEPDVFSVFDLAAALNRSTCWDGVRNYQARNFMRDQMKIGDPILVYHSNATPSSVVGVAHVSTAAYPDHTAFDLQDPHYDPKSKMESPTWFMVDIQLDWIFEERQSLEMLRSIAGLEKMELLRKGSRLSVQPVSKIEFQTIVKLGGKKT
ncbi:MAG: EVE domain-containing protein [Planctomycetota bacterium]|nr:EVE domain-containing protein [Planctomycetota bacterium]